MNRVSPQRLCASPSSPREAPPGPPEELVTLADVTRWRALIHPDEVVFTFLADGEKEGGHLSYRDLDLRAQAIAAELQARGAEGQRVVLLFPPGLDYVAAVFGCFYAGALAVPAYPPDPFRLHRTFPRLQAIWNDAQAEVVLTLEEVLAYARTHLERLDRLQSLTLESIPTARAADWRPTSFAADKIALIQYTSGSTGSPRGVILNHANIMHNLKSMHRVDTEGVGGVCWLPPYHDMGLIGGILQAAYSGRQSVLMSPLAFIQRPARWLRAMSHYRGRTSGGPNFAYELCVEKVSPEECEGLDLSSWTGAVSGAETVRAETIERFVEKFAPYGFRREAFLPGYGLAESVLMVAGGRREVPPVIRTFSATALLKNRVETVDERNTGGTPGRRLAGCGQPLSGGEIAIVDPKTRRSLGTGRVGEIWVRSGSVGQGYWNRPEETEAIFRARIAGQSDACYLRTGDLGFLHGGELYVTGRLKELILLGGHNYYPQDIERSIQQAHPALKPDAGAAFAVEVDGRERLVVVNEVLRPRRWNLDEVLQAIRRELAEDQELSPHAVALISAGSLPKTSSGKTRRSRCRELFLRGELATLAVWRAPAGPGFPESPAAGDPPQTETEKRLARLWAEVFGAGPRRRSEDFFALGGHSLRAVQLAVRVNAEWDIELPLVALFDHPTLAGLARAIDRHRSRRPAGDGRMETQGLALEPLPASNRVGPQPLSFAQERLWFLEQISPGPSFAVVPLALRLAGPLDVSSLREALRAVVRRHEVLRTTFRQREGRLWQEVAEEGAAAWEEVDLAGIPQEEQNAQLRQLADGLTRRPFDLERGPPFRAMVARIGEREHVLLLALHHIVCDGWSLEVLLRELAALYEAARHGKPLRLPPLPVNYVDFVHWQRRRLSGERLQSGLDYWKRRLAGAPKVLEIPTDRPRSASGGFDGAVGTREISQDLYHGMESVARQRGCTPFMVFLAAFDAILSRYTGSDDLCVGTPVANRVRPELEPLVGCFVNTVVLRCNVSGDPSFEDLLFRVRGSVVQDFVHAEVPFEKLVESLDPVRQAGRLPLVQVMFIFQAPLADLGAMDGVLLKEVNVDYRGLAAFDLTLIVEPRGSGAAVTLAYNWARVEESTIRRMLDSLVVVLEAAVADPTVRLSDLPIPAPAERRLMLNEWNATARRLPEADGIHALIAAQAARSPEAVAVTFQGRSTTYRELECASNRLAHYLRRLGVRPGSRVGIDLERSPQMITAILAVLKAGACYVPLDPAYPASRLAFMVADGSLGWVLSESTLGNGPEPASLSDNVAQPGAAVPQVWLDSIRDSLLAENADPPPVRTSGNDLAYLIYTSGSTGVPKGVMVPHRAVVNFLAAFAERPGLKAGDVVLAVTTISFDIAVFELLLPLAVGARIVLAPRELAADGWRLGELVRQEGVNVLQATPSTYRMLLATGWRPEPGQKLLCGGEAMSGDLASRLALEGVELWNVYGPTETTVWSTVHRVEPCDGVVPIGRPIANTQVYVLDAQGLPVPMGVPGELCIGGLGVAAGYWNRPELTARQFVPDPFDASGSSRLYRTGDRVRWRHDGVLEFLGRVDRQVKVRGFRVEPGEIESALAAHPDVAEAAVVAKDDASGQQHLVAHLVPTEGRSIVPETLRAFLAERLPEAMIPSAFVVLEAMPRTAAGKADWQALAAQPCGRLAATAEYVAPRTPLEEEIAAVWSEVLHVDRVGVHDNFFELGGHSLLATQMMFRLRDLMTAELPLRVLFERPTVAGLAEAIVAGQMAAASPGDAAQALDRLEQMSDEEARRMLESEGGAEPLWEA